MISQRLLVVKELSASVEKRDEDLTEFAIFRPHTVKLLRYYFRLSLEYGRIPSVLGGGGMRSKVSHMKMHTMEDDTIFLHDVGRCLEQVLNGEELRILALTVFMEHTFDETAALLGYSLRQTYRMFYEVMDVLTRAFFEREFLDRDQLMNGRKKPMGRAEAVELMACAEV